MTELEQTANEEARHGNREALEELTAENELLVEVISRIRTASEFFAQDGVADYMRKSGHEDTRRLCQETLAAREE